MAQKEWAGPSESEWDAWEQRLLDGEEPAVAAQAVGRTSSAFRRSNPIRHAQALTASKAARGQYVDEMVERWALSEDASDSMRQFWAKRWNREYAGQRLELSGPDGTPLSVDMEGRGVVGIGDVLRLARELGVEGVEELRGDSRGELPAAGEILPDSSVDQSAAGALSQPE